MTAGACIAGIPDHALQHLLDLFAAQPHVEAVWLFGSRAMGRHHELPADLEAHVQRVGQCIWRRV